MKRGSPESFWARVDKTDGCWNWTGSGTPKGYGMFMPAGKQRVYVHRYVYELMVGPIPEGLTLDHLCRNRSCVNPQHLEPVTRGENALRGSGPAAQNSRKTACPQGHPYTSETTSSYAGHLRCRVCDIARGQARRAKRKEVNS